LAVYCVLGGSLALAFLVFSNEIINFIYGEGFLFYLKVLNVLAIADPPCLFKLFVIEYTYRFRSGEGKCMEFGWDNSFEYCPQYFLDTLICEIGLITFFGIQSGKVFKEP
jgi:hypothetical protein